MLDSPDDSTRQAQWDRRCDAAPHCSHCGKSVYPHDIFVETEDGLVYCRDCFHIVHMEDLEWE